MIIISILAGLLSTMNFWTINIHHVKFHLNDIYMAFLMAGWMLFFEYLFLYQHIGSQSNLFLISILVISITFYFIRKQTFINDEQYLKGMIPHHSMAILMSEKIANKTKNPQIKKLANDIIINQTKEIKLMSNLLNK